MVKLEWFGDTYKKRISAATKKALIRSANIVEGSAKLLAPVDTGLMRSSFDSEVKKNEANIGNPVDYFPNVELGTKSQKAQPSLRPALFNNADNIFRIFFSEESKAID